MKIGDEVYLINKNTVLDGNNHLKKYLMAGGKAVCVKINGRNMTIEFPDSVNGWNYRDRPHCREGYKYWSVHIRDFAKALPNGIKIY